MGKATAPRQRRQAANDQLAKHGTVERINGVDHNHGGSPLSRWKATKQISPTQELAIDHVIRLWELAGVQGAPITAAYGERIPGNGRPEPAHIIAAVMDAKEDLARIESWFPKLWWQVFENCIRYDEPAGQLGSRLMGWSERSAVTRALTTVQFVADVICMRERLVA